MRSALQPPGVIEGQLDDVFRVVADPLDVDNDADQRQPGMQILCSRERQVREHLPPDLALIGVDSLILRVNVDIHARVVALAERADGGLEHLHVVAQHFVGPVERLVEQVSLPEDVEEFLEHRVTSES